MMRKFDTEALHNSDGDVFGHIYEYFLAKFSKVGTHDNGEFFTSPSIVQTIVNVIEHESTDTMARVTFYGHEKNETIGNTPKST